MNESLGNLLDRHLQERGEPQPEGWQERHYAELGLYAAELFAEFRKMWQSDARLRVKTKNQRRELRRLNKYLKGFFDGARAENRNRRA